MKRRFVFPLLSALIILFCTSPLQAKPKYLFKVATLAPSGSVWIEQFKKFSANILEDTGGEVGFRIYPGGVMGDDQGHAEKDASRPTPRRWFHHDRCFPTGT